MASTASLALPLSRPISHQRLHVQVHNSLKQVAPPRSAGRRDCLLLLTATTSLNLLALKPSPAAAEDIPLFGIRKKIEKAEKQAEELVKEGFETAEKGLESAEKGFETAEKKAIEAAEKEFESATDSLGFSGLAQAGLVAGAEFLGVVVATSVVNGILGPDPQKS